MAYMDQEKKSKIKEALDEVVPAGWKYGLKVRNNYAIVFTLKSADVDLIKEIVNCTKESNDINIAEYVEKEKAIVLNQFYLDRYFTDSLPIFEKILEALNTGNHNRSDIMSDYFDVGHYVDMNIGDYKTPFKYIEAKQKKLKLR